MPWTKTGLIFDLKDSPNRSNHCQVPTPFVFDDFIRVYYACRNNGKSFPAFFDLSLDLKTLIRVQESSIMPSGEPGTFDSDGVMPGCVIRRGEELWMYYTGWNELKNTARYHNVIGKAISTDGGLTFKKAYPGPVMDRTYEEPGLCVTPFVTVSPHNHFEEVLDMWYASGTSWKKIGDKYEPVYCIRYARSYSKQGALWARHGFTQCIESGNAMEAFAHPCVVGNKMWYCYRDVDDYRGGKGSYRIGYAEAKNGDTRGFDRIDGEVIPAGDEGEWDSDMQCYPYVLDINGKLVMFYNGNGFGQTGIGAAVWS